VLRWKLTTVRVICFSAKILESCIDIFSRRCHVTISTRPWISCTFPGKFLTSWSSLPVDTEPYCIAVVTSNSGAGDFRGHRNPKRMLAFTLHAHKLLTSFLRFSHSGHGQTQVPLKSLTCCYFLSTFAKEASRREKFKRSLNSLPNNSHIGPVGSQIVVVGMRAMAEWSMHLRSGTRTVDRPWDGPCGV
jgi:hypothetical protein